MRYPDRSFDNRRTTVPTPQLARPASEKAAAISDYALIGDCRTAALVSIDGSIDWLCFPNFSGPSVFAKLLDEDGGSFALCPAESYSVTRRYLDGTAVLETTFVTGSGSARILDCLPALDGISLMRPMREVLRIVEGLQGNVAFRASVDPRLDYARVRSTPASRGRLGWSYRWGNELLHVLSDVEFAPGSCTALAAVFSVSKSERRYMSLSYCQGEIAVISPLGSDADERLADTIDWWREWSRQITYDGPYSKAVVRSALTLKLLTFVLSGAIIAAPTTSLPEEIGGTRNWDYRYCWLRDAGLIMEAMVGIGIVEDAQAFLSWLLHATRLTWPKLQIMYDIYGRTDLSESELPHLSGYRGSRPVRIGNGAHDQKQLDVYGEVIHAASTFAYADGKIDEAGARMLAGLGKTVCETWSEPDSGIWEKRGERRHYTFSKVMCWVALDRLIDMQKRGVIRLDGNIDDYTRARAAIADAVESRGFNRTLNAYTKVFDGNLLDASVLLMPAVGYRDAGDERVKSTFALISDRLTKNGLVNRYEPEGEDHRGPEGTFGICSFWAIEQLALRGELAAAETLFAHLLSFGNDVGLFAEEIEGTTGEALGNFPQAFTHVGLINSARAIARAKRLQDGEKAS